MKVIFSPKAEKQLKDLSTLNQFAVSKKVRDIQSEIIVNEAKLSGYKNIYRIRIGNYRIVYRKLKDQIYIVLIHHRKDLYEKLKQLLG
jgi:mRNA interferase RelE/StbE